MSNLNFNVPISLIKLSKRPTTVLERMGIKTIYDLTLLSENYLLRQKDLGIKSVNEIKKKLSGLNIKLKKEDWQINKSANMEVTVHSTIMDYFAAKAMQAILTNDIMYLSITKKHFGENCNSGQANEAIAFDAYEIANAMLNERARRC